MGCCSRIPKNELDLTLVSRKGSIVYRAPEFLCCMILIPRTPFPVRNGSHPFSLSFYSLYSSPTLASHTTAKKLRSSLYNTHFTWRPFSSFCKNTIESTSPRIYYFYNNFLSFRFFLVHISEFPQLMMVLRV